MPRSADALRRRAEKRNISLADMRKIDAQAMKKVKSEGGSSQSASRKPKNDTRLMKKWTCKVCTNINLAHMCPKKCNNCQRPRVEVDEEYKYGSGDILPKDLIDKRPDVSSHWKCMKCNNKNMTKFFPKVCNRCQRDRTSEPEEYPSPAPASIGAKEVLVKPVVDSKSIKGGVAINVSGEKRGRCDVSNSDSDSDSDSDSNSDGDSDSGSSNEGKNNAVTPHSPAVSSEFWTCLVCKNRNICAVHKLTCNRCQRHRTAVEANRTPISTTTTTTTTATATVVAAATKFPLSSAKASPVAGTHWVCLVCKNRNICALHKLNCNRCQRHRSEVEDKKPDTVSISKVSVTAITPNRSVTTLPTDVWTCVKCKNRNLKSLSLSACNRCQRPRADVDVDNTTNKTDSAVAQKNNSWDNAVADKDLIDKNMQLRENFLNPETREALSEEEKQRAEVLIARSKRKLEKKEKRQAWKKKMRKSTY